MSTTHIVFWYTSNLTVLKYDIKKVSTEAVVVAAFYVTAYNLYIL